MRHVVQIELTNVCNRRCFYCGIPIMQRPKGLMTQETFDRCKWVLQHTGQKMVGMHHFGESIINPNLLSFAQQLNEMDIQPFLNTNGDLLTDDLISKLAGVRFHALTISGHMELSQRIELWQKCVNAGIANCWY